MNTSNRPATMRAIAISFTIIEACLIAATTYYIINGNAIALAVFAGLAVIFLFVTASAWGTDLDNRSEETTQPEFSPNELHDVVEVDYATLLRNSQARSLVITLRTEAPYATIEATNANFQNDWLVDGTTMFEAYVKAWLKTTGQNNEHN